MSIGQFDVLKAKCEQSMKQANGNIVTNIDMKNLNLFTFLKSPSVGFSSKSERFKELPSTKPDFPGIH